MAKPLQIAEPGVLLLLAEKPWVVSALPVQNPEEGHCGGDHLMLVRSPAIDSEYRSNPGSACSLPFGEWLSSCPLPIPVRIHSECVLGDVFGSGLCDCGDHLEAAVRHIDSRGYGVIIYLRQEGRGIGLAAKLRSLCIVDQSDTFERNEAIGLPADARRYDTAVKALAQVGIVDIELLSDSPDKREALVSSGLRVSSQICLPRRLTADNALELLAKQRRGYRLPWSGHDLIAAAARKAPSASARVEIDWDRVHRTALRLESRLAIEPQTPVDEWVQHPPSGHPLALEFYLLTILHQFAFWLPVPGGGLNVWHGNHLGNRLRGSDFIWTRMRWLLDRQASAFHLDPPSFDVWEEAALRDDDGKPVPYLDLHVDLAHRFRRYLEVHSLSSMVGAVRTSGRGDTFVEQFSAIPGYDQDPHRKKLHILFMYMAARSDSPLGLSARSLSAPAVDYHIQRLLLRTGAIVVRDRPLRDRLTRRHLLPLDDEDEIRAAAVAIVRHLIDTTSATFFEIDQVLFGARAFCGENIESLECDSCWLNRECRQDVSMFQPLSVGRDWY